MEHNNNFTATCTLASETLYRFFVMVDDDYDNAELLTQIDATNKAIPCPHIGEEVLFDINTPIRRNEDTEFYVDEIYRVKRITHCYEGNSANLLIDIVLEVIPFDNN